MRPENLFKLTPELKHAINRHPAANRQTGTGTAVTAAPAASLRRACRWRCHHPDCDATFTTWAAAQRHGHPPYGACRIELVLR